MQLLNLTMIDHCSQIMEIIEMTAVFPSNDPFFACSFVEIHITWSYRLSQPVDYHFGRDEANTLRQADKISSWMHEWCGTKSILVNDCSTIPETNVAPENWWLKTSFLLGWPIFRWHVSFREGNSSMNPRFEPPNFQTNPYQFQTSTWWHRVTRDSSILISRPCIHSTPNSFP